MVVDTGSNAADVANATAKAAAITGATAARFLPLHLRRLRQTSAGVGLSVLAVVLIIGLVGTLIEKDPESSKVKELNELYKPIQELKIMYGEHHQIINGGWDHHTHKWNMGDPALVSVDFMIAAMNLVVQFFANPAPWVRPCSLKARHSNLQV